MPKITDAKYHDLLIEQANEYNKRADWIFEMTDNPEYPGFRVSTLDSDFFKRQIDCRDMISMSSMFTLEGATEEEQKKNLQKKVYAMENALLHGPKEEAQKYVNMVFDTVLNFDEEKLDFSKKEDAFKCVSVAGMNQCFGTKKAEFSEFFNEKVNTPELKEKYYYANTYVANAGIDIYNEIRKSVVLNNSVTINTFALPYDELSKKLNDNVMNRDLEQYKAKLNGNMDILPLEYEMPENMGKTSETTPKQFGKFMDVFMQFSAVLSNVSLPGGTEGKDILEADTFGLADAVFINGKNVNQIMAESNLTGSISDQQYWIIAKAMADPAATVEICKLIPLGDLKYAKNFVPVHRDFKHINPELQKVHDDAFKKYMESDNTELHKKEADFMDAKIDHAKYRELGHNLSDTVKKMGAPEMKGAKEDWPIFDNFFPDENAASRAVDMINEKVGIVTRYHEALEKLNPGYNALKSMDTIEYRQADIMALFLAGGDKDMDYLLGKREEIHRIFKEGGDAKRNLMRSLEKKIYEYDPMSKDMSKAEDIYDNAIFSYALTTLANIYEEDHVLSDELHKNVEMNENIASKIKYSLLMSEFYANKLIDAKGSMVTNLFQFMNFENDNLNTASSLHNQETRRLSHDLAVAKLAAVTSDKREVTLAIPDYFSGYGLGNPDVEHFDISMAKFDADAYLGLFRAENNFELPDNSSSQASSAELKIGTAHQVFGMLNYVYDQQSNDCLADYYKANGIQDNQWFIEESVYINDKSLGTLIGEKMADVLKDSESVPQGKTLDNLRYAIKCSIMASAMADPDQVISQVFLNPNKDNVLEPKTIVLNKDYSNMVKAASPNHNPISKLFHKMGLHTYDEEKVEKRAKAAEKKFMAENKLSAIAKDFKEAHQDALLAHQAEFAFSKDLKLEALKTVNPEKYREMKKEMDMVSDIRKDFKEGASKPDFSHEAHELHDRPHLDKVTLADLSEHEVSNSVTADVQEQKNFERKTRIEISNDEIENKIDDADEPLMDEEKNEELDTAFIADDPFEK